MLAKVTYAPVLVFDLFWHFVARSVFQLNYSHPDEWRSKYFWETSIASEFMKQFLMSMSMFCCKIPEYHLVGFIVNRQFREH